MTDQTKKIRALADLAGSYERLAMCRNLPDSYYVNAHRALLKAVELGIDAEVIGITIADSTKRGTNNRRIADEMNQRENPASRMGVQNQ